MSFWKAAMSMRRMSRYWYLATVGGSHGTCKRQVTRSWSLKHVGWTATRDRRPVSLADVNKSSVLLPRVVSCTVYVLHQVVAVQQVVQVGVELTVAAPGAVEISAHDEPTAAWP